MIKDLIEKLRTVDKNTWGLYTFKRDPLYAKVSDEEKTEMIEKANECGRQEAMSLKEKYGIKSCGEYASSLGIAISDIEEKNSDDYILFAKFNTPNQVSINVSNVKKAKETIKEGNVSFLIDEVNVEDVLIAHEMFHFIEGNNKEIYTKSVKIRLWKLGPIKYDSGLVALGEIAAMAFAKELLSLTYYPNLFDILLLYPHDEEKAKKLYDEVCEMKGDDNNV